MRRNITFSSPPSPLWIVASSLPLLSLWYTLPTVHENINLHVLQLKCAQFGGMKKW